MVLFIDGKDANNSQCNLAIAAEHATPQQLAFLIRHGAGTVHACMDKERLEAFGLHPASASASAGANVYVSTNFLPGVTNGVSAKDRASTLQALCDTSNPAAAFSKPGHGVQLCGVLAELMNEDGTMYTREDAYRFSQTHSIPVISVEQLVSYRQSPMKKESTGD